MAPEYADGKRQIEALFDRDFGETAEICSAAPGRVNLIGEHTDYNEGFVFPAAIDYRVWVAARRCEAPSRLFSYELGEADPFDASAVSPGDIGGWAIYPAGMAWALRESSGRPLPNIQAVVRSDLPIGSGVSSSAALEMAFGMLWNCLANLGVTNKQMAGIGQACENRFVGVSSGIMDQMASAMGRRGEAMFLDTRTLDIRYAKIPDDLTIAFCDTGKQRDLASSAYNQRRKECDRAAKSLGVRALRDATLEKLESRASTLEPAIYRRARHVISENGRCVHFFEALRQRDYEALGSIMKASHESLRDDYEVSSRELNAMAESAWAADGCIGARMTGAGFGGACVALVETDRLPDFMTDTALKFKRKTGFGGNFMACNAEDGARILS